MFLGDIAVSLAAPASLAAQVSSSEILYVTGRNEVRKMGTNGSGSRLFQKCFAPGVQYCTIHDPVISPDGRRIAMVVNHVNEEGNNFSVWISSLSGSGARQVSTVAHVMSRPTWGITRNGTELIAYARGSRIHQVDLCRDRLPTAGKFLADGFSPSYDPTATWIALARANDIWKIRSNGSGETRVGSTSLMEKDPRWSKSATFDKIIFLRKLSTGWKLQIMDADGSNTVQKTTDGAEMKDPDAALLPNAFTWEQDGDIYLQIGSDPPNAPKKLATGARDPIWGHGTKRVSKTCP